MSRHHHRHIKVPKLFVPPSDESQSGGKKVANPTSSQGDSLSSSLQKRRYFFAFFRQARASARRARSARHARREGRVIFFAPLSSRVSRTSRSPCACPRSPEKRKKIAPVLQAIVEWIRGFSSRGILSPSQFLDDLSVYEDPQRTLCCLSCKLR